ncbi:hypothetical protein DV738_g3590, partial [Chaetothyriales sp. CBS 135597]
MPDIEAVTSRVSTIDGPQDLYDHKICLVDTTDRDAARSRSHSPARPSKKDKRIGIRDQLSQRKYARYSYDRYSKNASVTAEEAVESQEGDDGRPDAAARTNDPSTINSADHTRARGKKKTRQGPVAEIEVLYENQRGSFLFGMPLYSHSSLLHFDPAAWVTKDFKESPVDITNAQVPDLTWEWAWKSWYVDMSYDVDEQGWQYSFAFGKNSAWHGNHPWFHSFVRRRRWLRKRVKKGHGPYSSAKLNALSNAHNLTPDYFTIHSAREPSPGSKNTDTCTSPRQAEVEQQPPEDLKDIGSLLQALKLARIDREKIEMVKKFVNEGGRELVYLKQALPEIMSLFVFQNSKQQVLTYLELAAHEAKKHREETDDETQKQRIEALLATVDALNEGIRGLDYWSDRQHVLSTVNSQSQQTLSVPETDMVRADHIVVEAPDQLQCGSSKGKGKGKGKERANPNRARRAAPQKHQTNFYSYAKVSKAQIDRGAKTKPISVKTLKALSDAIITQDETPRRSLPSVAVVVAPSSKLKRKRSEAAEEEEAGNEQSQKAVIAKRTKRTCPPAVPAGLQVLGDIFQHFLKAFSIHRAHNGSSSLAGLDTLLSAITPLYKKRVVRREDVQRMLALYEVPWQQEVIANRAVLPHTRSPFKLVISGTGVAARHLVEYCSEQVYDETRLLQGYSELVQLVCGLGNTETSHKFISEAIEQYPLLGYTQGSQTTRRQERSSAIRNHILNVTPQGKPNSQPAAEPDLSRLSISGSEGAPPQIAASTKSRTLSLFDRIKTKQSLALLQPSPSSSQLLYQHALSRIGDVVEILRMKQNQRAVVAASTCNKLTLSMSQAVSTVKGSLSMPMGEEEIKLCFKILAEDAEGDWLKLVDMGGFQSLVVQGRCARGEEVRRQLMSKSLPK